MPLSSEAVHNRSSTAHCPGAVRQCIAGVPLPTAPRRCGSSLRDLHCPLPPGKEAVYCRSPTAHCTQAVRQCMAGIALSHCPQAVRQCVAIVPLPTAPKQCGSALQELHCPLPPGTKAGYCRICTAPCPGSAAVHCRNSNVHRPQAVW